MGDYSRDWYYSRRVRGEEERGEKGSVAETVTIVTDRGREKGEREGESEWRMGGREDERGGRENGRGGRGDRMRTREVARSHRPCEGKANEEDSQGNGLDCEGLGSYAKLPRSTLNDGRRERLPARPAQQE